MERVADKNCVRYEVFSDRDHGYSTELVYATSREAAKGMVPGGVAATPAPLDMSDYKRLYWVPPESAYWMDEPEDWLEKEESLQSYGDLPREMAAIRIHHVRVSGDLYAIKGRYYLLTYDGVYSMTEEQAKQLLDVITEEFFRKK